MNEIFKNLNEYIKGFIMNYQNIEGKVYMIRVNCPECNEAKAKN